MKCHTEMTLPVDYVASYKDDTIRMKSSSGGVFCLLSEAVIKDGGIVIGTTMSEDNKTAYHVAVDSINSFDKLIGSEFV